MGLPVWASPGDEAAHASLSPQPRPSLWAQQVDEPHPGLVVGSEGFGLWDPSGCSLGAVGSQGDPLWRRGPAGSLSSGLHWVDSTAAPRP